MNVIDSFRGTYRFLSNFYPCNIEYDGIEYPSTEHAYQAAKFDDLSIKQQIAELPTASAAKKAGKLCSYSDTWRVRSIKVMYDVCKLKFNQPEFKNMLLSTGDAELVEGNTWGDEFWGVCDGRGKNYLGKILMQIRHEIRGQ